MIDHGKKAFELFTSGYNCAQAVFGAYCEDIGLDPETGLRLASSFGGGMGRMREVCGAVSGMFMAAGVIYGYSNADAKETKTEHYKRIQELAAKFKEENGSIICRRLLGLEKAEETPAASERTKEYYHKRPCGELCRQAAEILDAYIAEHKPEGFKNLY